MKHVRHSSGLSYQINFIPRPDGAMLEILHCGKYATELIARPTLIPLAKAAHDGKDFDNFVLIFKTLGNADIAAMGI